MVAPAGNLPLSLSPPALPPPFPKIPFPPAALPVPGATGTTPSTRPNPVAAVLQELNVLLGSSIIFWQNPAHRGPEPSSGEGADQIAACLFENSRVPTRAAVGSPAFPVLPDRQGQIPAAVWKEETCSAAVCCARNRP